jgi:hypothetical protein
MSLTLDQIADLVLETQEKLVKRGAFVDMQTDLTDHVAVREMWDGHKKVFKGGKEWRFDAQIDHNHSAQVVGLYQQDGSSINDTMISGAVPVRHINAHYTYDLHEIDYQSGGEAIVDLVYTKNVGMRVSLFELMETLFWSKPADSSDKLTPYGIAYWVVKNATEGFNGGNPAGFTSGCADIDATTYPRWKNYTAQYATVNKTDLLRKMRKAHRKTQFRSPVSHATPDLGNMKNGIYTNDAVIGLLEEILEDQNMNLGNDLASKDGKSMFKSSPVIYVPKLDDDATNPVYMLDWQTLAVGTMAGWENNLTKPYMVPGKHNVRRVDLDMSMNMICTNRRKQAVISL